MINGEEISRKEGISEIYLNYNLTFLPLESRHDALGTAGTAAAVPEFFRISSVIGENGKKKIFFQVNILLNDITRSLTSLFNFVPCAIETVDYTSRCSIYNINGGKKESAARYIIIKEIALWKGLF